MQGTQRNAARQRFERWQALMPEDRARILRNYSDFRGLQRTDRARIRRAYRDFQRMTPERQQELRRQFRQLRPADRARILRDRRLRPSPRDQR